MSGPTKTVNTGSKKKAGSFLSRQAKAKQKPAGSVTEEELLQKDSVSPEDVLRLTKITESKCQFYSRKRVIELRVDLTLWALFRGFRFPRQKYSSIFNVKKIKIEFRNNITRVCSIESNSEILFLGCTLCLYFGVPIVGLWLVSRQTGSRSI